MKKCLGNRVMVKIGRHYFFIKKQDIHFIRSERNYSRIICDQRSFVIKRSLSSLEEILDRDIFLRINRSTIVNVNKIDEMKSNGDSDYVVVMSNNETLPWGRRYRENLIRLIRI